MLRWVAPAVVSTLAAGGCSPSQTPGETCNARVQARLAEPNPLESANLLHVTVERNGQTVVSQEIDLFGEQRPGDEIVLLDPAADPPIAPSETFSVSFFGFPAFGPKEIVAIGRTPVFSCADGEDPEPPLYVGPGNGFADVGGMQVPRIRSTASPLGRGRVLIVAGQQVDGGPASPTVALYDHRAGQFAVVDPACTMSDIPARIHHSATVLADGSVFIFGGQTPEAGIAQLDQTVLADSYVYDPATGCLSDSGVTLAPRTQHSAVLLPSGEVFIVGGRDTGGAMASTVRVDVQGSAVSADALNAARYAATATLLVSGRVLVVGGKASDGSLLDSWERFDDRGLRVDMSDATPCPSPGGGAALLCAKRAGHTATALADDSVLLWGGEVAPATGRTDPPPHAEVWLLSGERSIPLTQAADTLARSGHAAVRLSCRTYPCPVLITGGESALGVTAPSVLFTPPSPSPPADALVYAEEAAVQTFSDVFAGDARTGHTASLLEDWTVLLTGGRRGTLVQSASVFSFCEAPEGTTLLCPAL